MHKVFVFSVSTLCALWLSAFSQRIAVRIDLGYCILIYIKISRSGDPIYNAQINRQSYKVKREPHRRYQHLLKAEVNTHQETAEYYKP